MAVKWSWDEFDAEHSIILTSTTHSARYSNHNLIQFFVKYGKITSFVRLKASKCIIAIAKYVSKSDVERALKTNSINFYGLEMNKIGDHPMYRQYDISLYSHKNSSEIMKILQGFTSDDVDELIAINDNQEQPNESEASQCIICDGVHCLPNKCLTETWIEEIPTNSDQIAPADYFEDDFLEPPTKSSKWDMDLDVDQLDMDLLDVNFDEPKHNSIDHEISHFQNSNKLNVYLTHAASSNTVYIRSAIPSENKSYIKLIKAIDEYCRHAVPLEEEPEPGDFIAARFDGIYFRCRVVYVPSNTHEALVDFIDFGNVEKIQLSEALYLSHEFRTIKPTVEMVTLKGMTNKNAVALKQLRSLVSDARELILHRANGEFECELIDAKTGETINTYLRHNKRIPRTKPTTIEMKTKPMPLKPQMKDIEYILADGDSITVLIISNSLLVLGYIHSILSSDMKKFKMNDELINKIGQEMESLEPYSAKIPGELCLVKVDSGYYRAILTESKYKGRDRYEFIDYGYILPVRSENVRRLPENLLFPCITLKCFLDELPPINRKVSQITGVEVEKLQKRFPEFKSLILKRLKSKKAYNCCICSIQI